MNSVLVWGFTALSLLGGVFAIGVAHRWSGLEAVSKTVKRVAALVGAVLAVTLIAVPAGAEVVTYKEFVVLGQSSCRELHPIHTQCLIMEHPADRRVVYLLVTVHNGDPFAIVRHDPLTERSQYFGYRRWRNPAAVQYPQKTRR